MAAALIITGSILITLNLIAIKKEKKSFSNTVNAAETDMSEYKVEMGKMRKEFAETILELQSEIEQIKVIKKEDNYSIKDISQEKEKIKHKEIENNNEKNSVMINEVEKMLSEGFTLEEVSERLKMGKGEILLIKELYLK